MDRYYIAKCVTVRVAAEKKYTMQQHVKREKHKPGLQQFQDENKLQQMLLGQTSIGNLMQASVKEGKPRKMFSKDHDIVPFIDCHWEGMTTMARRVTQSWHATIKEGEKGRSCRAQLLGIRDSDYCHFTTVLEEEAPITGNDIPELPNLTFIRRKTDDGKQKNDNAVSQ
uniref:Set1/Ash2 histone methyltransferase complex subunit ASH2-like winged-helix domain-containing protein n=1 Tax=Timema bartmani TaxID=61472 RepID=A0A7R9F9D1_9NEOP|nr:unnamed protein product [Timema bartmani]